MSSNSFLRYCLMLLSFIPIIHSSHLMASEINTQSIPLTDSFAKGIKKEYQNRSFSLGTTQRLAKRFENKPIGEFWKAYYALEKFNQPIYQAAMHKWNLPNEVSCWTKSKAVIMGHLPHFLMQSTLKSVKKRTETYTDTLKALALEAPKSEYSITQYIVEQEALQVQIMTLALNHQYKETLGYVESFKQKYQDLYTSSLHHKP